ncbi:unnamed protein product [Ranitomeya imitator]|uniref:Breast cancer protein 1 n=1 Tax=Ranitomeya imitator TaxID=111125 RepID=A0ABN9LTA4_9NEOB|nr:unnamed protein product [Ranitomeya imitator]
MDTKVTSGPAIVCVTSDQVNWQFGQEVRQKRAGFHPGSTSLADASWATLSKPLSELHSGSGSLTGVGSCQRPRQKDTELRLLTNAAASKERDIEGNCVTESEKRSHSKRRGNQKEFCPVKCCLLSEAQKAVAGTLRESSSPSLAPETGRTASSILVARPYTQEARGTERKRLNIHNSCEDFTEKLSREELQHSGFSIHSPEHQFTGQAESGRSEDKSRVPLSRPVL